MSRFKDFVMNKKEGMRRTLRLLRILGWLAIVPMVVLVGYAVLVGKTDNLGDGVFVVLTLGGLLLGGAYVLEGFVSPEARDGESSL